MNSPSNTTHPFYKTKPTVSLVPIQSSHFPWSAMSASPSTFNIKDGTISASILFIFIAKTRAHISAKSSESVFLSAYTLAMHVKLSRRHDSTNYEHYQQVFDRRNARWDESCYNHTHFWKSQVLTVKRWKAIDVYRTCLFCQSYLRELWQTGWLHTCRQYTVLIAGEQSKPHKLTCVPQGSVIGQLLFTIYMTPLASIRKLHGMTYHLYADDTQLFQELSLSDNTSPEIATRTMERCVISIRQWMKTNMLKLTDDKTEILIIRPKSIFPKV